MTETAVLQLATQAVFILLFVSTLATFIRRPERTRLEVTALFGSVALIILLGALTALTGFKSQPMTLVATLFLLAQPYLLLRLVTQFRAVALGHHAFGLTCMVGSWVPILIAQGGQLDAVETVVVVILFAVIEVDASVAFVRAAATSHGVIKRRLVAIAAGAVLLALALLLAAWMAVQPAMALVLQIVSDLVGLGSAVAFYVGFALPGWLRRAWQMAELRNYLIGRAELTATERLAGARDYSAVAIRRALGASASLLALADDVGTSFHLHAGDDKLKALQEDGLTSISLDASSPIVSSSWRNLRSAVTDASTPFGETELRLATALRTGRTWLISPLHAQGGSLGLLVSMFDTQSPFLADELALSDMLAEQVAQTIDGSRLYLAEQQSAAQRASLLQLSQTLAEENSVAGIARQLAGQLGTVLATTTWGVLLEAPDGSLEVAAAGGTNAPVRQGYHVPPGHGITGRALRGGDVVVANDVRDDPDYISLLPEIRSELAVPLKREQDAIGVLNFESNEAGFFTAARVAIAQMVGIDVSLALSRARLLEALTESEARHRLIIDSAMDAVVSMDSTGVITGWNRQAETMFGLSASEALGRTVESTIIPSQHRDAHRVGLAHFRATGEAPVLNRRLEMIAVHQTGREFPVDLAISAVERDGDVSFTAFIRDITERKEAEAQLNDVLVKLEAQNVGLEEASRLKSQFLANMSHELRTPLNAILGFSELLLDAPEDEGPEVRQGFLDTIHDSGEHLLNLINDILDLSKVEAGGLELHVSSFEVSELMSRVVDTIRPLADRKGIALEADTKDSGNLVADFGRVRQILYNLVSNAIKFTPDGGLVRLEATSNPDNVVLSVIDNGIGIAQEDQDRIFVEFQQVDSSTDRQYQGTGLGLALTKRFVELHGGRIWVESALGRGSHFHVELPRQVPGTPVAAPPAASDAEHVAVGEPDGDDDRALVLVIEDDARAANLLRLYLARGGYRTVIAPNGEEALAQARALEPMAITLDILLPGQDGWEVLRQLKSDEGTRDIPVVVVSIVDDRQMGYALGAADYFVKPVDRQALLARLERYTYTTKVKQREVRVLVIDDDPAALELLTAILEPLGFTVVRASGGQDGIDQAFAEKPDLVLVDLMMPDVDGFDVISALKAEPETADIPILVVSAKDITDDDKARLNGYVSAVFHKDSTLRMDLIAWLDDIRRRTPTLLRGQSA